MPYRLVLRAGPLQTCQPPKLWLHFPCSPSPCLPLSSSGLSLPLSPHLPSVLLFIISICDWPVSKSPFFLLENLSLSTIHNTVSCFPTTGGFIAHGEKMQIMNIHPHLKSHTAWLCPPKSHTSDLVTCAAMLRSVGEWGGIWSIEWPLHGWTGSLRLLSRYRRTHHYYSPVFKVPCGNRDRNLAC